MHTETKERGQIQPQVLTVTARGSAGPGDVHSSAWGHGSLQGHTGLLTDQAFQLLEFRHHVRSEEVGVPQEGVLLAGHAQDGGYKPGTETDRPKNHLEGSLSQCHQ